jgi:hypothetical protein
MKNQLFLVLGTFRANPISGSALNLFQLTHLLPETGISLDLCRGGKDVDIAGGSD